MATKKCVKKEAAVKNSAETAAKVSDSPKYVYQFGKNSAEGNAEMKNLLGGKGANLAEMSRLGLPVPAGFTITTECCNAYFERDGQFPECLKAQV